MSGGSMDYLFERVLEASFDQDTPLRIAFKAHLARVADAMQRIEWFDSRDNCDREAEEAAIRACLPEPRCPEQYEGPMQSHRCEKYVGHPGLHHWNGWNWMTQMRKPFAE